MSKKIEFPNKNTKKVKTLPSEVQEKLRAAAEAAGSVEEFAAAILVGECPVCGSNKTADLGSADEDGDPRVGKCLDCDFTWCLECGLAMDTWPCPHWDICEACGDHEDCEFPATGLDSCPTIQNWLENKQQILIGTIIDERTSRKHPALGRKTTLVQQIDDLIESQSLTLAEVLQLEEHPYCRECEEDISNDNEKVMAWIMKTELWHFWNFYHVECYTKHFYPELYDPTQEEINSYVFPTNVCQFCEGAFEKDLPYTDGAGYYCKDCAETDMNGLVGLVFHASKDR